MAVVYQLPNLCYLGKYRHVAQKPRSPGSSTHPSSIPKWAPFRPIRGPFWAQLCPTGAQLGPTWNAAWAINTAIISDLAEAGEVPEKLITEGMSLEPWAVAYKPPKYKAADTALLAHHKVSVDQIQQSLRETRLLRLPDFDINSKTSEFSLMTTIPSVIIIHIMYNNDNCCIGIL